MSRGTVESPVSRRQMSLTLQAAVSHGAPVHAGKSNLVPTFPATADVAREEGPGQAGRPLQAPCLCPQPPDVQSAMRWDQCQMQSPLPQEVTSGRLF